MIAYLDCFAGISGDMTLAALVDLGVPVQWLQHELEKMSFSGFALCSETVYRSGIKAENVSVQFGDAKPRYNFDDACHLIDKSPYSLRVKSRSKAIFNRLAEAEKRVYGKKKKLMHLDEKGASDAVVKILGAVLGFEYLGIEAFAASDLPMGSGFVQGRHGILPLPAPLTLEILNGWPVRSGDNNHEMVTPIGAAVVAALSTYSPSVPTFTIQGVGYGAGKDESGRIPDLLRIIVGAAAVKTDEGIEDDVMVVETNIDDMNPEIFGYLMERLFEDGALDVVWIPLFMKKNRPGTKIEVLCRISEKEKIVRRILAETTSLGVRFHGVRRSTLVRRLIDVHSPWGVIQAKEVTDANGKKRIIPEYDVCRRIARENELPLRRVYEFFCRKS